MGARMQQQFNDVLVSFRDGAALYAKDEPNLFVTFAPGQIPPRNALGKVM
jgi:hypothetical protein